MSNSPESDLIKNLSPHERNRLMRHVGQSGQGSPKKGFSKNVTPKPFVVGSAASTNLSSVNPPRPRSSVPNRWQGNNSNINSGKASDKSSADIVPKLNPDHVKLFTQGEAASSGKLQEAKKKPPAPVQSRVKPIPVTTNNGNMSSVKSMANKFAQPSQQRGNVKSPPAPVKKPPISHAKPSNDRPDKKTNAPPVPVEKKSTQVTSPPKPKTPPAVAKINASNNAAVKWSPPSAATPVQTSVEQKKKESKPAAGVTKPQKAWQRPGPPLSNEKSSPSSPPTAVVAPMQERPKATSPPGKKAEKSASPDVGRQRAVSSPVLPPKSRNEVVSYRSSSDDVVLPEMLPARIEKPAQPKQSKPRSRSDAKQPKAISNTVKPAKLGHDFQPHELKEWVNWCDACGSVILSLFGKCVTCTKCKMVCHGKCALTVSLTCEADQHQTKSLMLNDANALSLYKTIVQETTDESTLKEYNTIQRVISIEEIQEKIEEFNLTVKGSQQMTLQEDGETFRGFIRVTMNLTRPVSVLDAAKTARNPKKSSFYIDKGAVKALHLTSDTTAAQVVEALLRKYNISDNPMKFALYEKQFREEGHVILRKMLPKERPLFLRLLWGNGSSEKKGFILQENESRDIHWESFSIGELQMFIKILDKEENDYITEIKRKYKNKSQDIRNAIDHQTKKG